MIAVFGVTAIISKPGRSFPHWLASIVLLVICGQSTGSVQGHDTTLSLTATSHLLAEAPRTGTHARPPPPPHLLRLLRLPGPPRHLRPIHRVSGTGPGCHTASDPSKSPADGGATNAARPTPPSGSLT